MRHANEAIIRERHAIPAMSDILPELHEATYFCTLDLHEGYRQLCLSKESRPITCFAMHQGLFQYKRLIYGVNTAFGIVQTHIELVLSGINGAKNISGDVLIWGRTKEDTIERLDTVLTSFDSCGLQINKSKCLFLVEKRVYSGYTLSADGISPDEHKVQAVKDCKTPTTVSEGRSFLGIVNFSKQFIHDYSTITAPLRLLTKKGHLFHLSEAQQTAFSTLKDRLCSAEDMAYYNPYAQTKLTVDASPYGLGASLSQQQDEGSFRPVAYGSKALTPVESRYSQTEREALAMLCGCEHFHYYLYVRQFTIETDHKPHVTALSRKSLPTPRIQRWSLRLQAYEYTLEYILGSENNAGFLSRSPLPLKAEEQVAEDFVHMLVNDAVPKALTLEHIATATKADDTLLHVIESVTSSTCLKTPATKPYFPMRTDLSIADGILLFQNRIVIPTSL